MKSLWFSRGTSSYLPNILDEFKKIVKSKNFLKLLEDQQSFKPPTPASNFLPDPQIANMFAQNVNPTTNLTRTETALLSPEEQLIRQRLRT